MAEAGPSSLKPALHVFSWEEINALTRLIADRMCGVQIDCIVGIARSGLVPAVILSHMLNVRNFAVVDIARTLSDDIQAKKQIPIRGKTDISRFAGKQLLVVDDIVGQGLTIEAARQMLTSAGARARFATLVVNQDNLGCRAPGDVVDDWACIVHGWAVFPWEGKDHSYA